MLLPLLRVASLVLWFVGAAARVAAGRLQREHRRGVEEELELHLSLCLVRRGSKHLL